jgi:hypothetical protein
VLKIQKLILGGVSRRLFESGCFPECALKTKGKISILVGMVKHVTSLSCAVKRSCKNLTADESLAKTYQKTLRILGDKKA